MSYLQRVRIRGTRKVNGMCKLPYRLTPRREKWQTPPSAWTALSLFIILIFVLSILGGK
jgi:hypothetical protein